MNTLSWYVRKRRRIRARSGGRGEPSTFDRLHRRGESRGRRLRRKSRPLARHISEIIRRHGLYGIADRVHIRPWAELQARSATRATAASPGRGGAPADRVLPDGSHDRSLERTEARLPVLLPPSLASARRRGPL